MKKPSSRKRRPHERKTGLPPGSLVHIGEIKTARPAISLIEFDAEELRESKFQSIEDSRLYQPGKSTLWLNVHGLQEPAVLSEIGHRFHLHPLVLEDILHTDQRPKVEDYGDYLYLVAHSFAYDAETQRVSSDQVSIVVGPHAVLTFQERPSGCFDPIRERLRGDKGLIRRLGADYLAYSLLDVIVDRYFLVLDQLSERVELLEEELTDQVGGEFLHRVHHLKRETLLLRRGVWPLREVLNSLQRGDARFFQPETRIYLRDVYDHTVHIVESLDSIRDLMAGLLDIYLSTVSNRVNLEVRVLTVITTLFLPASLIAGIFGMNFHSMPWLDLSDGFFLALGLMVVIALVMAVVFWRRRWLA